MNLRGDGFSMMEILVVIAIGAILATLAVPSYLDKIVRDQIVEALPLADIARNPLAASWAALQSFPPDNAAAGLPAPGKIVNNFMSSVLVRNGAIDLTFGAGCLCGGGPGLSFEQRGALAYCDRGVEAGLLDQETNRDQAQHGENAVADELL